MKSIVRITMVAISVFALQIQAEDKKDAEAKEGEYQFKVEEVKPVTAMTVRFKVEADSEKISAKYGEAFGKLFAHITANGGQINGVPFGRYHSVSEKGLEIEAGIPVAKHVKSTDEIKASELPGGKVVTTIHVGPYTKLGLAHAAMAKHVAKEGHKPNGGSWEFYLTDPGEVKDENKYQTKLFQPIAAKKK